MSGMWGTWGVGGVRVRPKNDKKEGEAFGYFDSGKSSRKWVVVLWDNENAPVCVEASRLMFKHLGERTFKGEKL